MAIAFGKMEDMVLLIEIRDLLKAQNCTEDIRKLFSFFEEQNWSFGRTIIDIMSTLDSAFGGSAVDD